MTLTIDFYANDATRAAMTHDSVSIVVVPDGKGRASVAVPTRYGMGFSAGSLVGDGSLDGPFAAIADKTTTGGYFLRVTFDMSSVTANAGISI